MLGISIHSLLIMLAVYQIKSMSHPLVELIYLRLYGKIYPNSPILLLILYYVLGLQLFESLFDLDNFSVLPVYHTG